MYEHGLGVPQSWPAAVDYYLLAAEQGDATGQYLLGLMYDKGFGVSRDVVQAYKWLNLAASHGPKNNREYFLRLRDAVASKMTRAQLDLGQQLALEWSMDADGTLIARDADHHRQSLLRKLYWAPRRSFRSATLRTRPAFGR